MASDPFSDFLNSPWFSWLLISIIFWVIIVGLVYLLRNKKEAIYVFFPLIALMKTKKLNNFITKVGKKKPKFWRGFWTIGIFISFGLMIYAYYYFFTNFISLIFNPRPENIISPLIPGVTVSLPYFAYLILPILFVMTTHEFAHGISSSTDDVEVKSTGIMGAGIFFLIGFGAFVEVDERELYSGKHNKNTRLRIAAAGTYVNGITALVAFFIIILFPILISPFYGNQVVQVETVLKEEEGGFNYGILEKGDVIEALKKKGTADFIFLDNVNDITLYNLIYNQTNKITCSVGDNLTLKIYIPSKDEPTQKDVILGPRYLRDVLFEYISNSQMKITRIYTQSEGGKNYDKTLTEGLIITKINGTNINVESGITFEKYLTNFTLTNVELTDKDANSYLLDLEINGALIGIQTVNYWMPLNDFAKFLTGNFPVFVLLEFIWLFMISLSIALFNSMPLPIFDGDRMLKEVVNWRIGEEYKGKRKKIDKFLFEKDETNYGLSEYRVEDIESVKIIIEPNLKVFKVRNQSIEKSEIKLSNDNYELIDNIGDGFTSTLSLKLPSTQKIPKKSIIRVKYNYIPDIKKQQKKKFLNIIRYITLFIVLGNFVLSYVKFGALIFW
jgi:membrane-associated protease RseP (regulator of RpoE activity)